MPGGDRVVGLGNSAGGVAVTKPKGYVLPKEGTVSLQEGSRRLSFKVSNVSDEERRRSWATTAQWLRDKAAWCDQMAAADLVEESR